jgi:molybdopterin molybdotransferase
MLPAVAAACPRSRWEDFRVAELITVGEAWERVLQAVRPLGSEPVALGQALGRVLAEDVESPVDVPPFDSSAMDGFAVVAGPAAELRVTGESRAGHPADVGVEPGAAIRIATGAVVPRGADAVVPIEHVEQGADGQVRVPQTRGGANVRRAGEDVRAGQTVLRAGTTLGPAELGVLASLGRAEISCARWPRVVVLVTGDELVEPGEPLEPGRIWSSNAYALSGQIAESGARLVRRETVRDTAEETRAALERALGDSDLVCVSGGVSVGPHDHVKRALAELGVDERYWGVALKPGKPTWFGTGNNGGRRVLVFGLPGNPVSAMVTFHLFVRPALRALQGAEPRDARATAVLDENLPRNPRREQAIRCRMRADDDGFHVVPTGEQGSHMLTSMLGARALALIPPGEGEVRAGERVDIELLPAP